MGASIHTCQRNVWRTRCARKPHYTKISYFVVNLLIGHHGYQQGHHTATPRRRYIAARCRHDPPFVYKVRTVKVWIYVQDTAMSCTVYKVYLLCGTIGIVVITIIVSVVLSEEEGIQRLYDNIFIRKRSIRAAGRGFTYGCAIRNWYINFSECVYIRYSVLCIVIFVYIRGKVPDAAQCVCASCAYIT